LIRQFGHLLQEIGQVPAFDVGAVGWLGELLGRAGLFWQQEEDDESVEFLVEFVLDGLVRCLVDLAGVVLISDLNGDAAVLVA
jgi:hypothetical protein